MRVILCVAFLVGLSGPVMSAARFMDGNTLLRLCSGTHAEVIYCTGYLVGVVDALLLNDNGISVGKWGPYRFCIPDGADSNHLPEIIKPWISANPKKQQFEAAAFVAKALSDVWPCK